MVKRKKWTAIFVGAAFMLGLAGCGSTENSAADRTQTGSSSASAAGGTVADEAGTDRETGGTENSGEAVQQTENEVSAMGGNRILIAYFSAGENSDVDVVSSASVTMIDGEAKGRLRVVADMIQEETGGDIFSIQTSVEYPGDGGALIDYAAIEQNENARPELTTHIEDLDDYDTIFVGYPNWWADMPMVMYSFFEEYDFSGKTIIPFNVHNGSRFSGTIGTIQELEPDAEVIKDGFTVSERVVADAAGDVAEWLRGLGY